MDSRISTAARPDVVLIDSAPRPTPAPARVSFGQILAAGGSALVEGAEAASARLPGAPLAAAAVRALAAGATVDSTLSRGVSLSSATPEGPGAGASPSLPLGVVTPGAPPVGATAAAGPTASTADPTSSIDSSLQQSAQLNMYYLQVQQQVDAQNRSFTALSNVLKTEHDSAKAAIQNIHS